jgi:sugar lactone lactonase YvrE
MFGRQCRAAILSILLVSTTVVSAVLAQNGPDEIVIEHHNLFPESIEYDETGKRFLLSSATEGTIYEVTDDGTTRAFIEDDDLISTVGIEIDHINNRLLVVNADCEPAWPMPEGCAQSTWLGSYDLATGERIFLAELSETYPKGTLHSGNDVAVDTNGNAYVTDILAAVIYGVDMEGNVSLFMENEAFAWINGIVAHPDGYLILGSSPGLLLKIPLDEPEVIPIELEDDIRFDITDGMFLLHDGSLVMVTFPSSFIYQLSSDDDWTSATRVATSVGHSGGWATGVALRGESVYTIYSHLNYLQEGLGDQDTFEIVHVEFRKNQ